MVRPWVRYAFLIVGVAFLVSQFFPVQRDNPPVDPAKTLYATTPMPPEVHAIFEKSCRDCHSNETTWPWYSHLAPISWMVADDVHGGRRHFNISEWVKYPDEKKSRKLQDICEQVKSGEMPDTKYTLVHRGTSLNETQRATICSWTETARKAMATPPANSPALATPSGTTPAPSGQ
jgi:hypothetical protein